MNRKNFTVSVFHDKRTVCKGTDLSPIALGISKSTLQFRIGLKIYVNEREFRAILNKKGGTERIKDLRKEVDNCVLKAEHILEHLPNPTRESFKRFFKSETGLSFSKKTSISFMFKQKIEELMQEESTGTAAVYRLALRSFEKYKPELFLEDIDEHFLKGYKNWIVNSGKTITTAQIYLRHLKAIFNKAIGEGYISERMYPFKNFVIGTSAKSKSVLYPLDIQKFMQYQPIGIKEARAKDYFFFCYLGNGMNFKDMCLLKRKDLGIDTLSFVREKTKRTNTVGEKRIQVHLHPEMKNIIQRQGSNTTTPDDYVFPILSNCRTALEKQNADTYHRRATNEALRKIGKKLEFSVSLCTNLARHSFATCLKLNGTPTSFITDALGHSSAATTEHYLKLIPDSMSKLMSESLLNFE